MFVDTHCHLDWDSYGEEIYKIISEMKEKNILAWTNTINYKNYIETKEKFKEYDNVKVCPGLYPQESEIISDKELEDYIKLIKKNKKEIVAIGEVGLDFKNTKEEDKKLIQEKRFKQMVELAIELDKPISIHTRNAEEKVLEIIREYKEKTNYKKFIVHCFSGKKKLIKELIDMKIYCSIPYIVKNTESFQILVKELPTKLILVETDSPFLHPEKIQNSPLSVPLIYKEIAKIKGYDLKEIENILYRNFMKLTM